MSVLCVIVVKKLTEKREKSVYLWQTFSLNVVSWYVWTTQHPRPIALLFYVYLCVLTTFNVSSLSKIVQYWNVCFCKFWGGFTSSHFLKQLWATLFCRYPCRGGVKVLQRNQKNAATRSPVATRSNRSKRAWASLAILCGVAQNNRNEEFRKKNNDWKERKRS